MFAISAAAAAAAAADDDDDDDDDDDAKFHANFRVANVAFDENRVEISEDDVER